MLDELDNLTVPKGREVVIIVPSGDGPISVQVSDLLTPNHIHTRRKHFSREFCRAARFSLQHEIDMMLGESNAHHQDQRHPNLISSAQGRS